MRRASAALPLKSQQGGARRKRQESPVPTHLVILGEREAIAWVLTSERVAFPPARAASAIATVRAGDTLLLYSTRSAFHNPNRDRGLVFGKAVATSDVAPLAKELVIADRAFSTGCTLRLEGVAARRTGVDLAQLIPRLESFPNKRGWPMMLRRPHLTLTPRDARLIQRQLAQRVSGDLREAIATYVDAVPPHSNGRTRA
jgi:hypothetical protein